MGFRAYATYAHSASIPNSPLRTFLSLRDPGHRFDVQRMDREDRRHQRAPPEAPCRQSQHKEQQNGVYSVQSGVDQVHPCRKAVRRKWFLRAANPLRVCHQREPRQRAPVRGVHVRESPSQRVARKALQHPPVLRYVEPVVEVDEIVSCRLPVDDGHGRGQKPANEKRQQITRCLAAAKTGRGLRNEARQFRHDSNMSPAS